MYESLKQLLIEAFNFFSLKKLNSTNPASFIYNLISSFSAVATEITGAIDVGFDRLDINNAVADDLDALGDNYDLERNNGTSGEGTVVLWTYSPTNTIIIPKGTTFATDTGVTFLTTQDCVIPNDARLYPYATAQDQTFIDLDASPISLTGDNPNVFHRFYAVLLQEGITYDATVPANEQFLPSKNIPIISSEIGRTQNVDAYTITVSSSPDLGGTNPTTDEDETGVTNELPIAGGSDPENDDTYRARIKAHMSGTSTTTITALEAAALFTGIDDARVLEAEDPRSNIVPPSGSVYLVVASARATYTPQWAAAEPEVRYPVPYPSTLKERIRNYVEDLRSVGIGIIVREADVVNINFRDSEISSDYMKIYVKKGTDLLSYTAIIESLLNNLFSTYRIGQDIYKTDVVKALTKLDVVTDIAPFEVVATRWDSGTATSTESIASSEGSTDGRDAILITTNEIGRPSPNWKFRLVHDTRER